MGHWSQCLIPLDYDPIYVLVKTHLVYPEELMDLTYSSMSVSIILFIINPYLNKGIVFTYIYLTLSQ